MQITASEFKAKSLKLMDEMAKSREPVVITKRGKPIARLVPMDESPVSMFGYMRGTVEIVWSIVDTPEVGWDALKDVASGEEEELYGPAWIGEANH